MWFAVFLHTLIVVSEVLSECNGNDKLHHSVVGVEPLFWKTPSQVEAATSPVVVYQSPVLLDEKIEKLSIKVIIANDMTYTCESENQKVTYYDGQSKVICNKTELFTIDRRLALRAAAEAAISEVSSLLTPLLSNDELTTLTIDSGVKCSLGGSAIPFSFTVPPLGYADTHFILYMTSTPIRNLPKTHAVGWPCQFAQHTHRPVAGIINYAPNMIGSVTAEYTKKVIIHELMHALGWHPSLGQPSNSDKETGNTYYNNWSPAVSSTGKAIQFPRKRLYQSVYQLKDRSTVSTAFNFATEGSSSVPARQTVVRTPAVLEVARNHFACDNITGVEIEDHTFGRTPPSSYFVGWEKRLINGEIMNNRIEEDSIISKFTLAMLQDIGYYNLTLSGLNIDSPHYGRGAGCHFLNTSCQLWHTTPQTQQMSCFPEFRAPACAYDASPSACLTRCQDEDRRSVFACSGQLLPTGTRVPIQYVSRDTYKVHDLYQSMEEAQMYGGCDELMDHCYTWRKNRTCLIKRARDSNCWNTSCPIYEQLGLESSCYDGDIRQKWADDTPINKFTTSAHCLPTTCTTNLFAMQSVDISLGSGTVSCSRLGESVGPGDTPKDFSKFMTYSPKEHSGIVGKLTCPDPKVVCAGGDVYPPFTPPLFNAPYYQVQDVGGSPMDTERPVALHVTRVRINGMSPCVSRRQVGECAIPIWPQSRIRIDIDGGPFVEYVIDKIFVSFGRDKQCSWGGVVDAPFIGTQFHRQRAIYSETLPWWVTADQPAYLCVHLHNSLNGIILYTNIPVVVFRVQPMGTFSALKPVVPAEDLFGNLPRVVSLGSPVALVMSNWGGWRSIPEFSEFKIFYSFAAVNGRTGRKMLLSTLTRNITTVTYMLPEGTNEVEGRVHLYLGKDMSDWFVTNRLQVTISSMGDVEAESLEVVVNNIYSDVNTNIGVAAASGIGDSSELVSEAFSSLDNMIDIVSKADQILGSHRRIRILSNTTGLRNDISVSTGVAGLAQNLVDGLTAIQDVSVSSASSTYSQVSYYPERLESFAQDTSLSSLSTLCVKMSAPTPAGDVTTVSNSELSPLLGAVDNIIVASQVSDRRNAGSRAIDKLEAETKKLTNEKVRLTLQNAANFIRRNLKIQKQTEGATLDSVNNATYSHSTRAFTMVSADISELISNITDGNSNHRSVSVLSQVRSSLWNTNQDVDISFIATNQRTVSILSNSSNFSTATITSIDRSIYSELNQEGLISDIISTSVEQSDGVGTSNISDVGEFEMTFNVNSEAAYYPTLAECQCSDATECNPPLMKRQLLKRRNPETSSWETIIDPLNINISEYCEALSSGVGSGWRAHVLSKTMNKAVTKQVQVSQLSELLLRDETGATLTAFTLTNPKGSNTVGELASNAGDANIATQWVDYNEKPLLISFSSPIIVSSYSFMISLTTPEQDPSQWTFSCSNETVWEILHGYTGRQSYNFKQIYFHEPLSGYRYRWFSINSPRACSTYRLEILKQKSDIIKTRTPLVGEMAAFLVSEVIPSLNTKQFIPGNWKASFENINAVGIRVIIVYAMFYLVFFLALLRGYKLDARDEKNLSERVSIKEEGLSAGETWIPNGGAIGIHDPESPIHSKKSLSKSVMSLDETDEKEDNCWTTICDKFRSIASEMRQHTWFAILFREPRSSYTRVQRLTVLFTFMITALFVSVLFFGRSNTTPIKLVSAALIASATMAPTTVLLRLCFQRSQRASPKYEIVGEDDLRGSPILGELSIFVQEVQGLPLCDRNMSCDPYCITRWENKKFQSQTAWEAWNPVWAMDENLVRFPVRDELGIIRFSLHDDDGDANILPRKLGQMRVFMNSITPHLVDNGINNTSYISAWYPLRIHQNVRSALPFGVTSRLKIIIEYTRYAEPIKVSIDQQLVIDDIRASASSKMKAEWALEGLSCKEGNEGDDGSEYDDEEDICLSKPDEEAPIDDSQLSLLERLRAHKIRYAVNCILVVGLHVIGFVFSEKSNRKSLIFAYIISSVLHLLAIPFLAIGQVILSCLAFLVISTVFVENYMIGILVTIALITVVLSVSLRNVHVVASSITIVFGTTALQAVFIQISENPPWTVEVLASGVIVTGGILVTYAVDYKRGRPFVSLFLYSFFYSGVVAIVLNVVDWDGKAVALSTGLYLPLGLLAVSLCAIIALKKALRGPIFPNRLPPYFVTVGYALAVFIHIVTAFFSFVYLLDISDEKSLNPIFNGTLWTYWQDMFVNEPLKIMFLSQLGPVFKTVMKGGFATVMKLTLEYCGLKALLNN